MQPKKRKPVKEHVPGFAHKPVMNLHISITFLENNDIFLLKMEDYTETPSSIARDLERW